VTVDTVATGLSEPTAPLGERWRHLPRWLRVVIVVVLVAIVYQFAASIVGSVRGSGPGARGNGSSYDTSANGSAGFARLLTAQGFQVTQWATPLTAQSASATGAILTLDPTSWTTSDTHAVLSMLHRGATVVVSGHAASTAVLRSIGATSVTWKAGAVGVASTVATSRFTVGVATVSSPGSGRFVVAGTPASVLVLAASSRGVLAVAVRDGGWLVALASPSLLENTSLASNDNAAFGVNLARTSSREVSFDEYNHGFGAAGTGLAGLPGPWRVGLGVVLVAIVVWLLSAARRFGPPQRQQRELLPPRINYVTAVAALLETRKPEQFTDAVVSIQTELRAVVAGRLGLGLDATEDEFRAAARRADSHDVNYDDVVTMVYSWPDTPSQYVALGRTLAALRRDTFDLKETHV
jgi:hypothetical protein